MAKGILWAIPNEPIIIPRRYPNGNPHHITLMYGCDRSDVEQWIGKSFTSRLKILKWNDRVEAIRCLIPDWIPFTGRIPHITCSWVDGANPVEAIEMLLQSDFVEWDPIRRPIEFTIAFHEWETRSL